MRSFTIILLVLIASVSFAQKSPINFESVGHGADWTWTVFENASNPALEIIANPDPSGANTSATVAKFTALKAGNPWAGVESLQGNLGEFYWDETNRVVKIMVWKSVISDVGIKFDSGASPNDWSAGEVKVANTVTNQWEELTFNFSGSQNPPSGYGGLKRIIIFPDFNKRDQDNVAYFDNITFSAASGSDAPSVPAGLVVTNTPAGTTVGAGEIFLACGPNSVGGNIVYKLFYSKTTEVPADPTTATEYMFGSTDGDGEGINPFGFVIKGLEPATEYSFWLYQYDKSNSLFSNGAATAKAISGETASTSITPPVPVGFIASKMIGEDPTGDDEIFLACGPNQVGDSIVYKMFYSKTSQAPADPKTATEYIFGTTGGDGDGINAFGFVLGGLEPDTNYSFWLYQYNTSSSLFSIGAATANAGGDGTQSEGPNAPINFEADGFGADWTWTVFENATNPALEIIDNPDASGINTSSKVAKFTALEAGAAWAGVESAHGTTDLGPFVLDATNSTIKIMVWKSVISDVGIKLVANSGWAQTEVKVANTLVDEWEELTFDFSNYPNPPQAEGLYDQIVIFPDFDLSGRKQTNVAYFDNITFSASVVVPTDEPTTAAPTPPDRAAENVISVFSNAYANVAGTDFNPGWGQSTLVSTVEIAGNQTLKYANFNYQGITFASALDVSGMEKLHVDMWTANATEVNVFCISPGPVETAFALAITPGQWVSYDIPLSAFVNVNMADVIQFKFDGGDGSPTIYLDNLYFYKVPTSISSLERNELIMYPNPVKSGATVQLSTVVSLVDIFDLTGKLIQSSTNTSSIKTDGMIQGLYFVRINSGDGAIQTNKLVIK